MEEIRRRKIRYACCFAGLVLACVVLMLVNISSGSTDVAFSEVVKAVLLKKGESDVLSIVWSIRLPRTVAVFILGGALSVSGFMLQTFFSNPIAGPFVLGISSGAKLCVAIVMIAFLGRGMGVSSVVMVSAAFVGAMISLVFVLLVSGKTKSVGVLIICGVMIGYICSALTDFIVTFADDSNIVNLHNWSMGSFSGIGWQQIRVMAVVVILCMVASLFISKPMGAFMIGEAHAVNVGVNIKAFKALLILLSGLLAATVTAFAGPVSFVGVAVPHLSKKLFSTSAPLVILPGSFLLGSALCMFCDLIARTAFAPTELSISTVTAVFGAPVVIWIMLGRRKKHE
ncbi:MAG: iron ABC transporter permease [Eubacterium sp.]|nr:iron ABC transporter permease [Eubacterium sp.]